MSELHWLFLWGLVCYFLQDKIPSNGHLHINEQTREKTLNLGKKIRWGDCRHVGLMGNKLTYCIVNRISRSLLVND